MYMELCLGNLAAESEIKNLNWIELTAAMLWRYTDNTHNLLPVNFTGVPVCGLGLALCILVSASSCCFSFCCIIFCSISFFFCSISLSWSLICRNLSWRLVPWLALYAILELYVAPCWHAFAITNRYYSKSNNYMLIKFSHTVNQ